MNAICEVCTVDYTLSIKWSRLAIDCVIETGLPVHVLQPSRLRVGRGGGEQDDGRVQGAGGGEGGHHRRVSHDGLQEAAGEGLFLFAH